MKKCSNTLCLETNPQTYNSFSKRKSMIDGLSTQCKSCVKAHKANYYLKNKDKINRRNDSWYNQNKNRADFKAKRKESGKKFYKENRDHLHEWNLKSKYNITLKDYNALLLKQNNVCAICSQSSKTKLAVDHDHKNGKVRGLLCKPCNLAIGIFKDNVQTINAAIAYLKENNEEFNHQVS